MIIGGVFFIPWALKPENLRETKNKINSILYNLEFGDRSYNAQSLAVVNLSDGDIFISNKANEPRLPASLATLFVIEYASTIANLDDIVSVSTERCV